MVAITETQDVLRNGSFEKLESTSINEDLKKKLNIDDIKLPYDFNTWTAQAKRDWLWQNITTLFPNTPKSLHIFIPGAFCPINTVRSLEQLPEWMDIDKYRRGQKFVRDHYFSLIVAKLCGLIYSFTFNDGQKIVILGENSHTPYLAFPKYFFFIILTILLKYRKITRESIEIHNLRVKI